MRPILGQKDGLETIYIIYVSFLWVLQVWKSEDLPATEPQLASALPCWLGNIIHSQPHMPTINCPPSSTPEKHVWS